MRRVRKMRRTKLIVVIGLVTTLMLVGTSPATAAGVAMRASLKGVVVGFDDDPAAVAERCPAGYQWITQTAGSGELTSEAHAGPVAFFSEHCSRVLAGALTGHAVGKVAAGLLTLAAPGGDQLYVAYRCTFVFNADVAGCRTDVNCPFEIAGGTGIFTGASGHGDNPVVDNSGVITMALIGTLALPS